VNNVLIICFEAMAARCVVDGAVPFSDKRCFKLLLNPLPMFDFEHDAEGWRRQC